MNEEKVTKCILKWLLEQNWNIICFDFPQSGTGRFLHPNDSHEKNKDSINPDIIAIKNGICVFFENKDRYYYFDFEKQYRLITDNNYTDSINELLHGYTVFKINYGIGFPCAKYKGDAVKNCKLVDFIVGVNIDETIRVLYDRNNIFDYK